MMKRLFIIICLLLLIIPGVAAITNKGACDLDATLLNQDPYPAVPGEIVKLVFQIDGLSDPDCGTVSVIFKEEFPFTLDPSSKVFQQAEAGTYIKNYGDFWLIPYKVRVNKDALDGDNKLSLDIKNSAHVGTKLEDFEVNVRDLRTDFEIAVKEYNPATRILTFQILNIGENDVEALTVDIPTQDSLAVKGSSRNIVGSLDSNDDTTFSFEGIPKGGDIKLIITYTDEINERRILEKITSFDSDLFNNRAGEEQGMSAWFYVALILVLIWVYRWYRNRKNKKRHSAAEHN